MNGSEVIDPLFDRILGRVLAEDMVDLKTGEVVLEAGEMVTEEHAERIENAGVDQALIRSPLCVRQKPASVQNAMAVIWRVEQM